METLKTFRELFNAILTADNNQSRLAARGVRKLLYSSHGGQYKDIASIIENAPKEYAKINEDFQQENGNIRQAAVRMIGHELGPLTYHIRFPGEKSDFHKFSLGQAGSILFGLFTNLNNLAANLWKPEYRKCKYIDSLPTGPYKSIQLILS